MSDAARKRMGDVLTSLLREQPFWGSLALRLEPREDSSRQTLGSDGVCLHYNAQHVEQASVGELRTSIARVCTALALKHHTRRNDRDYATWQRASQSVTLPMLASSGFELPASVSVDPSFEALSCEEAYARLMDEQHTQETSDEHDDDEGQRGADDDANNDDAHEADDGNADQLSGDDVPAADGSDGDCSDSGADDSDPGERDAAGSDEADRAQSSSDSRADADSVRSPASCDPTETGEVMDAPADVDTQEHESDWDEATVQAAQVARAEGRMPGAIDSLLVDMRDSTAPWEELLARYMHARSADDYRWTPPNRRLIDSGLYLPSMRSEALAPFVLCIDTSGSIYHVTGLLRRFWAEFKHVCETMNPESVVVMQCDAELQSVEQYRNDELPDELEICGGGGTSFVPCFERIEIEGWQPAFCLYFTDMWCNDFPETPDCDVLWCDFDGRSTTVPPFGDVIDVSA